MNTTPTCADTCTPFAKMFKNWRGKNKTQTKVNDERIVDYDNGGGTFLYKSIEERQWKSTLSRMTMSPHEVSTFVYRYVHCTKELYFNFVRPLQTFLYLMHAFSSDEILFLFNSEVERKMNINS